MPILQRSNPKLILFTFSKYSYPIQNPLHIGYQIPGKRLSGAIRGHILLDNVPASRGRLE
ncbi:MAG: hypothetical protein HC836_35455 [Richelia sp. RM2_1_2]|nr:hypothetical protein [Richelia sp. SM2_1_7]NJM21688.1 hypothetical protein [Richelia sp. SM1_7_0]NJN14028.1 hypothetical protein [Richelia sp. RM1_1_1]NJO31068.1 hypothetical protein [Richelia sp. SL_2_1]NJO63322.1 hypothetical protein [Richelia sp. RM2_1_2]